MKRVVKSISLSPTDIKLIEEEMKNRNMKNMSEFIRYIFHEYMEEKEKEKEKKLDTKLNNLTKKITYLEHFLYVFMDFDLGLDGNLKEFKKDAIKSMESELSKVRNKHLN